MALVKQNTKFETVDADGEIIETVGDTAADAAAEAEAAKQHIAERLEKAQQRRAETIEQAETSSSVAVAETKSHAVVETKSHAVAASTNINQFNPFKAVENAFPVAFNTLRQINAVQGNFMDKDTGKPLGDVIGLELISTQTHFVLSPGDDSDESKNFVKYSKDGITSDDGESMLELLRMTKEAGYPDASINERVYLVGCLFNSGKVKELADEMVQIDLPPTSKAQFERHKLGTAFGIGKGKKTAEGQMLLRLECIVKNGTRGTAKLNWTEVSFSQWKD